MKQRDHPGKKLADTLNARDIAAIKQRATRVLRVAHARYLLNCTLREAMDVETYITNEQ